MSRCVHQLRLELDQHALKASQILYRNTIRFAEVKFFFVEIFGGEPRGLALASLYSPPNENLLRLTHDTLIVCEYKGEENLVVIPVQSILSVVAMVPFPCVPGDMHFMIEKIGLDVIDTDDTIDEE